MGILSKTPSAKGPADVVTGGICPAVPSGITLPTASTPDAWNPSSGTR